MLGVDGCGVAAGEGAAADDVREMAGAEGVEAGASVAAKIAPSSSETSFGGAVLPEKNSAALSAGSADGAGG